MEFPSQRCRRFQHPHPHYRLPHVGIFRFVTGRWAGSNHVTGANSRPASPLDAGRQFGRASCAPPSLPAAGAQSSLGWIRLWTLSKHSRLLTERVRLGSLWRSGFLMTGCFEAARVGTTAWRFFLRLLCWSVVSCRRRFGLRLASTLPCTAHGARWLVFFWLLGSTVRWESVADVAESC